MRISDKKMLWHVVMSTTVVLLCVAAMGFSAFAYFSYNLTSDYNFVKTGSFETRVDITDENGDNISVITSDHKSHTALLSAGATYHVTLEHTNRSTVDTGFVVITAENCTVRSYHTAQIGKSAVGASQTVSFWITPSDDTTVTFRSHWGTSTHYTEFNVSSERYVSSGDSLSITINNPQTEELTQDEEEIGETSGEETNEESSED